MIHTETFRFEPRRALSAMAALLRDPDDTAQVFTIIDSFSLAAPAHMLRAFRADPGGRRLLAARPDIVPLLADRAALRRMPAGSLAHAYLAFVEGEQITADGLVAASDAGRTVHETDGDLAYVGARMRDTHDLWHTVTGYHGDVLGEAALLAFNIPQTRNPGIALIVLAAILRLRQVHATRTIADGLRRGLAAEWLPAVEWESLLPLPLGEVRARLSISAPVPYEVLRTQELRKEGLLEPRAA